VSGADLNRLTKGPPMRIHLIGVAGSGMSGIASLLLALGHRVSGSDRSRTDEVDRLERKGLVFDIPHRAGCVRGADLVIHSSAVRPGNAAFDAALDLGIPVVRRAEALAAIMDGREAIVVCGTHGKTTTSSLLAHVLRHCGLKPSHYVGAEIPILGTNAHWDSEGGFFVAEGDESDGTLANYHPCHAIVLNIEPEHLDFYRDAAAIDAVFARLCAQTRGLVVFCGDDPGAGRVCSSHPRAVSYGSSPGNRYRLRGLSTGNFSPRFEILRDDQPLGHATLNIPGAHNALNALAATALATELGLPFEDGIAPALASFRGARRRFEIRHQSPRNLLVDDYGHHPTEIAATLATARTGGWKRVLVMFQPHRHSRTALLKDAFAGAFDNADAVFVSDIYGAGEDPLPGVSGATIVGAACAAGHPCITSHPDVATIHRPAANALRDGDLVITLGAGNIHEACTRLAADLALRDRIAGVMGPGRILIHEPLGRHTTMRVGGPARFWVEPETEEGFAELVRFCHDGDIPFLVMGRGSNLLVRDGGFPGVVACPVRGEFLRHEIHGVEITAGVGIKLKQLAAIARNASIGGFEWMEGIPGNLGGALRMNAGAMGTETFDQVVRVRSCDRDGNLSTRTPAEMEVLYRNVPSLHHQYALSATLRGFPSPPAAIATATAASESKRRASQPVAASAGCIFQNPASIPAGKLIEELGLKNLAVGGARVSPVHANFIVNEGGASARDVLTLIARIREAAERERGIRLETEIQILGEEA
jgi:UDP-N-acetylmuramate--alanine ligase